ncbi:hypothetical protein [Methylopila sp. 73B]|uniref:hypothetical protein n=1 Tax=Methylopila sp. 73B TaxID=1120792 RepID=UPI00037B752B|nr:hypothetical protein [Methylopila sp. 73B]
MSNANDTARLTRIESLLDELVGTVSSGFGELKGVPQRLQVLEAATTRIDTTMAALIGTTTRQELRADGLEKRITDVERIQATNLARVEGAWWLSSKFVAAIGGAGGVGAFVSWLLSRQ